MARLLEHYKKNVVKELMKKYNLKNVMQVPKLQKVVINVGIGESKENHNVVEVVTREIASITGQKPVITKAKKSISNFKLREGMPVGCMVTIRGVRMYEFLDKLISLAMPRIRDFKGINPKAFDANGNYNLGLTEQHIFPEIDIDKSDRPRGMNITVITSTKDKDMAYDLLEMLGFPFRKNK